MKYFKQLFFISLLLSGLLIAPHLVTSQGVVRVQSPTTSGATPTPDYTTGLKLQLVGDTAATGTITTWSDSSGQGNTATAVNAPTGVAAVVNGHKIVRFTASGTPGASDYFTLPDFASAFTEGEAFLVVKVAADPPASTPISGLWWFGSATTATHFPYDGDSKVYDSFGGTVRQTTVDPATTLAQFNIYDVYSASADWQNYLNNVSLFSTGTNTVGFTTTPRLGCNNAADVCGNLDIAELRVYDHKLSGGDRLTVYTFLKDKYATP